MKLLTAIFLGTSIVAMAFVTHKDVSVRHTAMDTGKYHYFLRIDMSPEQVRQSLVVMDSIMQTYGQDMMNSAAIKAKQLHAAYAQYLWTSIKLDSVLIETKPIIKPKAK